MLKPISIEFDHSPIVYMGMGTLNEAIRQAAIDETGVTLPDFSLEDVVPIQKGHVRYEEFLIRS